MVVFPGGQIVFVEVKAPGKKPTPLQQVKIKELQGFGCIASYADSKDGIDAIIRYLTTTRKGAV